MKKKNTDLIIDFILRNGDRCVVDKTAYNYILKIDEKIKDLELEKKKLELEKKKLELEIKAIKPVLEFKNLKPAISKYCGDCAYCVKSTWNRNIFGCCKDYVCEDFKLKKENEK